MNATPAGWLRHAAEAASRRLGWGAGSEGAYAVARAAGFAGYLARAGEVPRPPNETLMQRLTDTLRAEAAAEVSAALTGAPVRHCFIKGAGLLGRVYEPGDRELLDVDLVVHADDVGPAIDVITGLGFLPPDGKRASAAAGMRRGGDFERGAPGPLDTLRLDVQWAVAPVNHLLSYADAGPLERVWPSLDADGPLPAPATAHHLALVLHHLAHHDLLHARGLLDAVLLWERLDTAGRAEFEAMARVLGVRRLARALGALFEEQLGFTPLDARGPRGARDRALRRHLEPAGWLAWAAGSDARTHLEITPERIGRRLVLVDRWWDVVHLARDLVFPPRAYLRWRWPAARTALGAWTIHVRRVVRKAAARDLPV